MISGFVFPSLPPVLSFRVPSKKRSKHPYFYWYRYVLRWLRGVKLTIDVPHYPVLINNPNAELSPPQHSS
jgi:hypothetical protein